MKSAAGFCVLVVLGVVTSTAVAGHSATPGLITATLPITTTVPLTTTLPLTTTVPQITTTLPVSTTLPLTTTVPKITTTLPVTTTVPKVTTTLPVTTTVLNVTTTLPVTTALPKVTTTLPGGGTTTLPVTTVASVVTLGGAIAAGGTSTPTSGAGASFLSGSYGYSTPAAASASLFTPVPSSGGADSVPPTRLRSSRGFLTYYGPKAHRFTVIVFRLRHAGRVRFTVVQVAPLCRVVGSFTVRGHAGTNKVRFNGRLRGRRLPAGTYEIGVRTLRGTLRRVTVVIFASGEPTPLSIAAERNRNVCGTSSDFSGPGIFAFPPFATGSQEAVGTQLTTGAVLARSSVSQRNRGILRSAFVPENVAKSLLVILFLSGAALLFGVAALPPGALPNSRAALVLIRWRFEVAALASAMLLSSFLALVLR